MSSRDFVGELVSHSAAELQSYGATLGRLLTEGLVIVLAGSLGVGKTTFVQGLARGMGIASPVTSPTFALVHLHEASPLSLVHCDFYRLESEAELEQLGVWEYFTPAHVVAIEWGQAYRALLPENCLQIEITARQGERILHVCGPRTAALEEWVRNCRF
ncbi:MAG: tRNA (adenosine(37)-N6)-threonylcarbamoyltransferase complex ATPase subunit type 1 TsaE [Selenomonadales bacterium]|nr:tRNA (adenosine(37)-N6)-threonylcarbamoyltransferase complex ATPase subunit type 1 TsaE [Selenomonadales bacterium]